MTTHGTHPTIPSPIPPHPSPIPSHPTTHPPTPPSPDLCECGVTVVAATQLLGGGDIPGGAWSSHDIGLFSSILASLSPSLVIPGVIRMVEETPTLGFTPQAVLNAAPIEVVLAIILYNIFATLEQAGPSPFFPWVAVLPLWANILRIPANVAFSAVLGYAAGWAVACYYRFRSCTTSPLMKRVLPASTTSEYALLLITTCYTLNAQCTPQYIQQSSGVLAVFAASIAVSEHGPPAVVADLKDALAGLWVVMEIFLFTSTGISLSLRSVNGPEQSQRGMSPSNVGVMAGILLLGTLGRAVGIAVTGAACLPAQPPHRRTLPYFVRWLVATWTFQMPKAIQATLGGLPYANHIIPGADGLQRALFIQQGAAFSVLFMGTLGVLATSFVGRPLAVTLAAMDRGEGGAQHVERRLESGKKRDGQGCGGGG